MIRSAIGTLTLGAVVALGAVQATATTNTSIEVLKTHSFVYGKKLTKAQCEAKKGYIWSSSKKKCVKDTRGSY